MDSSSGSSWKKPLLIGCIVLSLLGIGAMLIVIMNWSRISGFITETTTTLKELSAVRTDLQERFRAPQVAVKLKSKSDVEGTILSIEVVNAPFFNELMIGGEEGKLMAFDIAGAARAALPQQTHYPHYEVIFGRRSGSGLKFSRTRAYSFEEEILQPPPRFMSSGTDTDDDVAEPLRADVTRFETALKTANTGVEHLRSGEYSYFYARCSERLHDTMNETEFVKLFRQPAEKYGPIKRFKAMQWKFVLRESGEFRYVYCTKIVEHEKAVINYNFVFDAASDYREPVEMQWYTRSIENEADAPK